MNQSLFFVMLMVVLGLLMVIVAKRKPRDEREVAIEAKTGQAAYVTAQILILLFLLLEKVRYNHIEGSLVAVFLGMTFAELVVRKINERNS